MNSKLFSILLIIIYNSLLFSQDTNKTNEIDILRPSKAAFYSAVLPGLGQIYNKKAWKVPIVYAAIGISAYSYDFNKKKFWSYRDAYKKRKAGFNDDEYQGIIINDDRLLDGQDFHKKYKDLSMVFIVGFYFLNILDANIDAHLLDFNVNENLSFKPYFENNQIFNSNIGVKIKISL
tara:strand:+ start:473 stop:1003 length:531 start_codon:yes stop_codon:yes gene_type:complete